MKMLALTSCALFCLLSPSLARAVDPPLYCRYGKVTSSQPNAAPECLSSDPLVRLGAINLGLCGSEAGFSNSDMDGYLKVDGVGKHILIGSQIRVKGDGNWLANGNGHRERITFYDSLVGYTGEDRTNTEGNAYLTYTTSGGPSGPGLVWAINNDYTNVCSKKEVYFQRAPRLVVTAFDAATRTATLSYEIDRVSKNAVEGLATSIVITTTGSATAPLSQSKSVTGTSGSLTIRLLTNSSAGNYTFAASMSDGTFSTGSVRIGTVTQGCRTGEKTVISTSPGTPYFDAGAFCGSVPGGVRCPHTGRALSPYSYPPVEIVCL